MTTTKKEVNSTKKETYYDKKGEDVITYYDKWGSLNSIATKKEISMKFMLSSRIMVGNRIVFDLKSSIYYSIRYFINLGYTLRVSYCDKKGNDRKSLYSNQLTLL